MCCLYRVVVDIVAKRELDIYPIGIVLKGRWKEFFEVMKCWFLLRDKSRIGLYERSRDSGHCV